jgi:cellulose synthase/poly-beta-1,6-N-acetylglucosamine synthase-like glycosyltransferase
MISIIITAYKEENSIGKAIDAFIDNRITQNYEILAVCPDESTKRVIKEYEKKYKSVKHIEDQGFGKPAALNKAFKVSNGNILILTDGDVHVSSNSVKELLMKLEPERVGAVSGRPVSVSPRKTMLGYWSHLLTDAGAHLTRLERVRKGKFLVVSGYLFAMKKLFDKIPEDALADDAVISHMLWKKGFKIDYAENALVYVKYPTTFRDWILQKRRSTGGYKQIKEFLGDETPRMRSFKNEVIHGTWKALTYPNSPKEFYYTVVLFLARLYLWFKIYIDLHLKRLSFKEIWKRVETTK